MPFPLRGGVSLTTSIWLLTKLIKLSWHVRPRNHLNASSQWVLLDVPVMHWGIGLYVLPAKPLGVILLLSQSGKCYMQFKTGQSRVVVGRAVLMLWAWATPIRTHSSAPCCRRLVSTTWWSCSASSWPVAGMLSLTLHVQNHLLFQKVLCISDAAAVWENVLEMLKSECLQNEFAMQAGQRSSTGQSHVHLSGLWCWLGSVNSIDSWADVFPAAKWHG